MKVPYTRYVWYKWKQYTNWSLNQINTPLQLAQFYVLLVLYLSKYGINDAKIPIIASITILIGMTIIGYIGVEHGWWDEENSLMNQHNPELILASKGGKQNETNTKERQHTK